MLCPNCHTVNPPNAKFCLECGNRLLICPNCGTVNLPVARFCIECGTPLQSAGRGAAPAAESGVIVEAVAPESPALLLPSEERRVVTVMFADITGSTPLADRLDPEDMRAILTGYFNLMAEQIRKHGGTIEKYIGDAVMAIFGAPIAHEDDPDRAIRAALDMQAALARFNEQRQALDPEAKRLQMRIGINTGEVAIPSNVRQRQDFLITGDAVNMAARLQQVAAPDTILVGERTYLSTREVFEFRPIAPLHIKGKAEPISACVVLGPRQRALTITQHPRGIQGRPVQLIGRSLELTLLHANYARVVAERRPHLITVLGAPGVGKSRLIREFIAREQDKCKSASAGSKSATPRVLQGHCPPYGEGITYWPLIEILRSLLHVQTDESIEALHQRFTGFVKETLARARSTEPPEEVASTIIRSIGQGLGGQAPTPERDRIKYERQITTHLQGNPKQSGAQGALLRAWRILLEALAAEEPLIIIVDDLQWADEALLDLLEYLTDRITSVPILFLCPARSDFFERRRDWGGGRRNFTTIELEALSQEESSELIDALLNTKDLPDVLRNTIMARSEGNPFFVEEIIRMFIDQGLLVCEEDHEHTGQCWRIDQQHESVLNALNAIGEPLEETTINTSYVLPVPVPDTIQGVLAARIDLLNPVEKLVLQHAAIIGRTFWLSSLLELASDLNTDVVLEALVSLIRRDFIIEAERQSRSPVEHDRIFSFKHVLIRDVAYNNIPRMRRTQEHARLALWLEEKTASNRELYAELLAYHYQQALLTWSAGLALNAVEASSGQDSATTRLTRPELRRRAITYLIMAGDQALHSYYTTRALQAYNDAFDLMTDSETDLRARIRLHEKLGDAHSQRGSLDEAWQQYRQALRLATEEGPLVETADLLYLYQRLAELAMRWLSSFDSQPDMQEIRAYIDAGLQLLEGQPLNRDRIAFLTYQAFWYIRQLDDAPNTRKAALAQQALDTGQEALRQAEELNDPGTLSLALDAMAFIQSKCCQYQRAHELVHRRQGLEHLLTEREELFDLYYSLGYIHEHVADYAAALMWFGRAWSNAQAIDSPGMMLTSIGGRMRAWQQWDRWENARQAALEILHLIEQYHQDEKRQLWALETLATIAYRTGDCEQGDHYARQYKRLIEQQASAADQAQSAPATRMHAIHLACGDWDRAVADYKEKLRASEPMPSPEILSTLAELMITTGEKPEIASAMCERALTLAEESGARKSFMIALRARGRLRIEQAEWNLAEDDLRQALNRCEALDLPWERGTTLYYLGILYKRRASRSSEDNQQGRKTDVSRASYHFEQALGFFESLKAQPDIEKVQLALMQDTMARV
jgi:class 3 adenylate cyclase/tetratricopeptide (TPR) repeat protein